MQSKRFETRIKVLLRDFGFRLEGRTLIENGIRGFTSDRNLGRFRDAFDAAESNGTRETNDRRDRLGMFLRGIFQSAGVACPSDMVRDVVDQGSKWEYWETVTWKVRAEDADNAFEGTHRISMSAKLPTRKVPRSIRPSTAAA